MNQEILAKIKPGAKVKVWEKIPAEGGSAAGGKEADKERQSPFSGIVIARKHGNEPGATFTVRAVISEVGVEKIYPINSPMVAKIQVLSSPKKVHRSKLYFLRKLSSKKVREKLKI